MNNEEQKKYNQEKKDNYEEKIFKSTWSKDFLETVGKEQIWDQLRTQVYSYFQNFNWYVTDASVEKKDDKSTFIIKVIGKKGIWKETKDEAQAENKTMWQKAKEKIGVSK